MERPDLTEIFRRESGRATAALIRRLGDWDLAEDAVQDAFVIASQRWPVDGVPTNPGAWITTTARNRALDRLRREAQRPNKEELAARLGSTVWPSGNANPGAPAPWDGVDDQLCLIFTCCHPALAFEALVALTLRTLGGLATAEIARAFLVPEATMAQRLVRAKRKIETTGIAFVVPDGEALPERLDAVLAVLYLIFNEAHTASSGEALVRVDLAEEAIRLGRLLVALLPRAEEAKGLLATVLLTDARRAARIDATGEFVRLADQDRNLWDRERIAEGLALLDGSEARRGRFQLYAALAAAHARAEVATDTDWQGIVAVYDELLLVDPTPVVRLNRAVAVGMASGAEAGLAAVDRANGDGALAGYHLMHAARAEFLRQLGRTSEADEAIEVAAALTANETERRHLLGQRTRT